MDNRYNISQLFKLAFGVNNPVYIVNPIQKDSNTDIHYSPQIKEVELKEAKQISKLGTPVVFPVMFEAGDYNFYDENSRIVQRKLSEFWFPPATLVDFSRAKNITRTDVIGGSGTVKEIYGLDDWSIRIRTICMTDKLSTREYEKRIIEWANVVQSIPVVGDLFGDKNIYNLVIESIDIKSIEGAPNVVPIELNCVSDEPFEIVYR